jgi:hypothetical protein
MSTPSPLPEGPALSTPLREARIAAGLTQVEFGVRIGYAQSLVSRLERWARAYVADLLVGESDPAAGPVETLSRRRRANLKTGASKHRSGGFDSKGVHIGRESR